MNKICAVYWKCRQIARELTSNCAGQDMIEYALMAGFIAVGVVGLSPTVTDSFIEIMSKANSVVIIAGS